MRFCRDIQYSCKNAEYYPYTGRICENANNHPRFRKWLRRPSASVWVEPASSAFCFSSNLLTAASLFIFNYILPIRAKFSQHTTHFDKITPDESPSEIWISFGLCQLLRQNSLVPNQSLPFLDGHKLNSILHVENKNPTSLLKRNRVFILNPWQPQY